MTSKEVILSILKHREPPRIGFDFIGNNPSDILRAPTASLVREGMGHLEKWGRDPSLTARFPDFSGELMITPMGNIFGRFDKKTNGECIKGALQDGWELFNSFELPSIVEEDSRSEDYGKSDKFVLGGLPFGIFSSLRDCRHMDNALMDTLLEPEMIRAFLDKIMILAVKVLDRAWKNGIEGIIIYDDLGTQQNLFFSPETFRTIFKFYYQKIAAEIHDRGMMFFLHSCGRVHGIAADLVEAGVDVFQFDQPELSGSEVWAGEFGRKAAFFCPVDIQKIMATGDRNLIERGALNMVNQFKSSGGSLIAMDYPNWQDINVLPEWQQWARDVIIANAEIK